MGFKQLITWMDWATIVFSFISMFGIFYTIYQNRRKTRYENQKIDIRFDIEGVDYLLDLDIPRKQISRSEIQGILAAFQNNISDRYSIEYLSDLTFLDDIFQVQNNKLDILILKLSEEEFKQFNPNKMKRL